MPELIHKEDFVFEKVSRNNPTLRVMNFLIENREKDFTITEIADASGVARTTLWSGLLDFLMDEGMIIRTRVIGNAKMYKLNKEEEKVKALVNFHNVLKKIK